MRAYATLIVVLFTLAASAQQVPKKVVAEHFTNTYCSICANSNPGFYNNLSQFPQVLHISYYPSAPYAACPLSQQNVAEQDARTNHYGIYGGTPRLVVQGKVISPGTHSNPNIFQSEVGQTSSFYMHVTISSLYDTAMEVSTVIRKVDTSSISNLQLYGAAIEDTLSFAANNGEPTHYDVFRRSIFGSQPLQFAAPANIGDSLVYSQTVSLNGFWNIHRAYALVMLQESNNTMVQAAKSAKLEPTMGMLNVPVTRNIIFYPNPAGHNLYVSNANFPLSGSIISITGQTLSKFSISDMHTPLNVSSLSSGIYFLRIERYGSIEYARFVKR